MAYTLAGLRTKVQNKLENTGISSTKITDWLNDTQREAVEGWDLPFMETTAPYTLTVSDADITSGSGLPATFDRAISVRLTTADYQKVLKYTEFKDLVRLHPDLATADTGTPTHWYKFANTIKVFPEPDIAYTLSLDYYKIPTELSDDADVPEIPALYEELLVIGAYLRALEHDDDYDEAAVQRLLWDQKHINMVRKTTQKNDGPSIIGINRRRTTRIRG